MSQALRSVSLDEIRIDGGTQPRAAISEQTVSDYAASMHEGAQLPPIDLFFDGAEYWLADGFHRYHAARQLGLESLTVTVHAGTRRDAVLYAVGANQAHGLRRTNEDKHKAVMTLVNDAEWTKWSGSEMGRRCGVSHDFACRLKAEYEEQQESLSSNESERSKERIYTTKHGTEATMNTERIGRGEIARTKAARDERIGRARDMASNGYTTRQIAAEFGISADGLRVRLREHGIDVPADRVVGKSKAHDTNRILEHMAMDAENLTADTALIDYSDADTARLREWIASFKSCRNKLSAIVNRLSKELDKHVSAA